MIIETQEMQDLECVLDKMFDDGKQHTQEYKKLHKKLIQLQCEAQWDSYENPIATTPEGW